MAYNNRRYRPRPQGRYRTRARPNYRRQNTRYGTQTQYDWKKIAWQAAKGALAYSMTNAELKNYDESNTANITTGGGRVSLIRGIAQGDTENSMDGNSIRLKSITHNMAFSQSAAATNTRISWWVIMDSQPLAAEPAFTDIFSSASTIPLMNLADYPGRFTILKRGKVFLNSTNRTKENQKCYLKLNRKLRFNDSQVPKSFDLLFVYVGDEATNLPAYASETRLRYYDN